LRGGRGEACGTKSRKTAKENEDHHFETVLADNGKTLLNGCGVNAVVDDGGHDGGERKVNENLRNHEKRRENGNIPIGL
jgi:hypothetical protein